MAVGFCVAAGLLAGCAADVERGLSYADSLERSAERLREHGHVQNADALEKEAQRHREATLSSSIVLMAIVTQLFSEAPEQRPTGFAGPIDDKAPALPSP